MGLKAGKLTPLASVCGYFRLCIFPSKFPFSFYAFIPLASTEHPMPFFAWEYPAEHRFHVVYRAVMLFFVSDFPYERASVARPVTE